MFGNDILKYALMAGLSGGMGGAKPGAAAPGGPISVMENPPGPTSPNLFSSNTPPSLPVLPQMGTPIPTVDPYLVPTARMPGGMGHNPQLGGIFQGLFGGR